MGNWVRELDHWAPSVVKVVFRGDPNTRRHLYSTQVAGGNFNVLLTTYEFIVREQGILSKIYWKYIIIDEGHRMKNANCKLAMTLGVRYRSRNRLLLTGTPLQNNLTELWALLNFLLPNIFSSADTFEQWFKKPFEQTTMGDTAELEEEETFLIINRLHQVLRPFLLRRLKTDVESQLPEKVESVILCDMSVWQRVLYRQMQNRVAVAMGDSSGSNRTYNNLLMQLKKICNHPFLFYGQEVLEGLSDEALIQASGKFALLRHVLLKLKRTGHRTLIFSQMTAALDYLEDFLSLLDIHFLRLDGTTKADERQELLNIFNAPHSPYFCFLLSTRAGGLGLNLQAADTVIIFDSDWNPMMDLQAQDRAHRIGQTKEVRVFRLISSGTVEVKILDRANQKLHVDAQIIQAGQFNNLSTETDRETMLKSILRQQSGDADELGDDCPDLEEINRMVARSDEEFELFVEMDADDGRTNGFHDLMTEEAELPPWVIQAEVEHKTAEERVKEEIQSHGRGHRRRSSVQDLDQLTEREWIKVMEGVMTVEEAFNRRKNREVRRRGRKPRPVRKSRRVSYSERSTGKESEEKDDIKGDDKNNDEDDEVNDLEVGDGEDDSSDGSNGSGDEEEYDNSDIGDSDHNLSDVVETASATRTAKDSANSSGTRRSSRNRLRSRQTSSNSRVNNEQDPRTNSSNVANVDGFTPRTRLKRTRRHVNMNDAEESELRAIRPKRQRGNGDSSVADAGVQRPEMVLEDDGASMSSDIDRKDSVARSARGRRSVAVGDNMNPVEVQESDDPRRSSRRLQMRERESNPAVSSANETDREHVNGYLPQSNGASLTPDVVVPNDYETAMAAADLASMADAMTDEMSKQEYARSRVRIRASVGTKS